MPLWATSALIIGVDRLTEQIVALAEQQRSRLEAADGGIDPPGTA